MYGNMYGFTTYNKFIIICLLVPNL